MPAARITETSEGRIILTQIPPINGKSICLEVHRNGELANGIRFLLLTPEEFDQLREDVNSFVDPLTYQPPIGR